MNLGVAVTVEMQLTVHSKVFCMHKIFHLTARIVGLSSITVKKLFFFVIPKSHVWDTSNTGIQDCRKWPPAGIRGFGISRLQSLLQFIWSHMTLPIELSAQLFLYMPIQTYTE